MIQITGANAGIGYEITNYLYSQGCSTIVLACRSLPKAEKAKQSIISSFPLSEKPKSELEIMELDLEKLSSVRRFINDWENQGRTIDYLFLNAGAIWIDKKLTEDDFDQNYQVCFSFLLLLLSLT
jgi:NADP-dependent 3-hydroxy acid dehydrogenase YdfG